MIVVSDSLKEMVKALGKVQYQPSCSDKRFILSLEGKGSITLRQYVCICQMYHRYRRQIPNHKMRCKVCAGKVPSSKYPNLGKYGLQEWDKIAAAGIAEERIE